MSQRDIRKYLLLIMKKKHLKKQNKTSARQLIDYIVRFHQYYNLTCKENNNKVNIEINDETISIDLANNKFSINGIKHDHSRIFDLTNLENHSVVMLLIHLFAKGYSKECINLEKKWPSGHDFKYLDVMLTNPKTQEKYMIEVKKKDEIEKYLKNKKETSQLISYYFNEANTKIISFYTYDFENSRDEFYNIYIDDVLSNSSNFEDFYDKWNKRFETDNYISSNEIFSIKKNVKKYNSLLEIKDADTKILFNQFLTILRIHSISDKPNAFIKMINLLLAKIGDEFTADKVFYIIDKYKNRHEINGLKFQFVDNIDSPESFMKRLNELYKIGMKKYLNQDIIDYNDDEIEEILGKHSDERIIEVFDNLRLKRSNYFAFIDVFDNKTFIENFEVVREIVKLLADYRFKYDKKYEFLGDFFESLLNTSLKQEAGQFFTPYPIVDFIVKSLPFKNNILEKIKSGEQDFVPKIIDYACGAGHFLISAMSNIQDIINELNSNSNRLSDTFKNKLKAYSISPYTWVNKNNVVGIEKDYRLAKTSKIATFLNGDGDAEILYADGINKFNSEDYKNTILYKDDNKIERFDYVISNPPYSVDGFMSNLMKNGIGTTSGDFELLKTMNLKDSAIEKYFVERAWQLVQKNGFVAIILPQSILSNSNYEDLRKYIFKHFKVYTMLLSADITFKGTTTSPVILFMKKQRNIDIDYKTMLIYSPKYFNPTASKMKEKETKFLGYKFSNNRNNSGISKVNNSILESIVNLNNGFLNDENISIPKSLKDNIKIVNIKDIIINRSNNYFGDVYPKYIKTKGKSLSKFCEINVRTEKDFKVKPTKYEEIGNLDEDENDIEYKDKTTTRFCKKGDILVASLNPTEKSVTIAKADRMLSPAIYVLSGFENNSIRDKVLKQLKSKEVLKQMNSMCDGFKITYAKISVENLYKNVKISV